MALQPGKPKMPPSKPRQDEERETPKAIVEDADKTEGRRPPSMLELFCQRSEIEEFRDRIH